MCCLLICVHPGWVNCFPSGLAVAPGSQVKGLKLSMSVSRSLSFANGALVCCDWFPARGNSSKEAETSPVWAEMALAMSCASHQLLHGSLVLFRVPGVYFQRQREMTVHLPNWLSPLWMWIRTARVSFLLFFFPPFNGLFSQQSHRQLYIIILFPASIRVMGQWFHSGNVAVLSLSFTFFSDLQLKWREYQRLRKITKLAVKTEKLPSFQGK